LEDADSALTTDEILAHWIVTAPKEVPTMFWRTV